MAAAHSNIPKNVEDVRAIERVFTEMKLDTKLGIDINEIINILNKLHLIDDCVLKRLRDNYTMRSDVSKGERLLQFNRFLWELVALLSLQQLLCVLCESINQDICENIVSERRNSERDVQNNRDETATPRSPVAPYGANFHRRSTSRGEIPRAMPKRRLPYGEHLGRYYIELKVRVENNAFPNDNRLYLEFRIVQLDTMISSCENPRRKQLLSDKRIALYFLLAQLCADFRERMNILRRLHDSMPHGVDRTMFKAIYHSNMAVSWAMKGNVRTALEHVAIASEESFSCSPCLPVYTAMLGAHITHTEIYLCDRSEGYLKKSLTDYENVSQIVKEAPQDEKMIWKSGTLLIMASALLGIKFFSKVCNDDACPDIENVEKARHILAAVRQLKSLPKHRELMLYLCMGKLHDVDGNIYDAVKYIRKARALAHSCSSNVTEKSNISAYLNRVQSKACFSCFSMTRKPGEIPSVLY